MPPKIAFEKILNKNLTVFQNGVITLSQLYDLPLECFPYQLNFYNREQREYVIYLNKEENFYPL